MPNKGTGAGGSKTTKHGCSFEEKTKSENYLIEKKFVRNKIPEKSGKFDYFLLQEIATTKKIYLTQGGLKTYFKKFFDIELFRNPDEAFLICDDDGYTLKILEKKNQNVPGSVDTKLLAGIGFIEEYQMCLGEKFKIEYAFCISEYLKKLYLSDSLKYKILRRINEKYKINVFFGDDEDYLEKIAKWINL